MNKLLIRSVNALNMKFSSFSFNKNSKISITYTENTETKITKKSKNVSQKIKKNLEKNLGNLANKNSSRPLIIEPSKIEQPIQPPLMEAIFKNYITLWSKSMCDIRGKQATELIVFQKQKLNQSHATQIEEFLMKEFLHPKENVYDMHLYLVESCLNHKANHQTNLLSIYFLNKIFDDWYRQQANRFKRNTNKNGTHLTNTCTDKQCYCTLVYTHIIKAFEFSIHKSTNLLQSLNKIYKFEENYHLIKPKVDDYFPKATMMDKGKIISTFKLYSNSDINYDDLIIPLMIEDKHQQIEDFINNDEMARLTVVEVCDRLCDENTSIKKTIEKYCKNNRRRLHKFRSSTIAKYAVSMLKKAKKTNLIQTRFKNIAYALKLNQLMFLINLKYHSFDPISEEAWHELVVDHIGEDRRLKYQLFKSLFEHKKDIKTVDRFLKLYGEEWLDSFSYSQKDFYNKNIDFILTNKNPIQSNNRTNIEYYNPAEFKLDEVEWINNKEKFNKMIEYFESNSVDIIGLDCEWQPMLDSDEPNQEESSVDVNESISSLPLTSAPTSNNGADKKNRANTFQIATRDRVFIIEVKKLVDNLSEETIKKFGDLVLFSENIIKLGYYFEQDGKKLANSFSVLRHKFYEFTDNVINLDEIAGELRRKESKFFPEIDHLVKNMKNKPRGLSKLTLECFGKPLDKSECMSNWANDPLRQAQIKYAALDSFVLIQIHDFFQQRMKELEIEYEYVNRSQFL